jgi:hypothetical protein
MRWKRLNSTLFFVLVLFSLHCDYATSCVFRSRQTKSSLAKYNKITHKKLPQTFSFTSTAAVILNYFLWPFAIIKSSFEPFVYSARLFLLLIDFSLHIMGIQIQIKAAEKRGDVVSI